MTNTINTVMTAINTAYGFCLSKVVSVLALLVTD